jgi:RNA polymerase sigma factor (sigma-70 family)
MISKVDYSPQNYTLRLKGVAVAKRSKVSKRRSNLKGKTCLKVRDCASSKAKKPELKLIKSDSKRAKTHTSNRVSKTVGLRSINGSRVKGELTPLEQESLILNYRERARKLGRSMLRKWQSRMDLEEVDSVVDLSLCEAVKRFNPSFGASFMTFLFYHLKGNLVKAVSAAVSTSLIPAAIAELTQEDVGDYGSVKYSASTLNAMELAEAVSGQDIPQPDEALLRKEIRSKSSNACERLDALEREIIKRLFVQEQQIIDIASTLGYSRCHISRVKRKALNALQEELSSVVNLAEYGVAGANDDEVVLKRSAKRRPVYRRRPRSIVAIDSSEERVKDAVAA